MRGDGKCIKTAQSQPAPGSSVTPNNAANHGTLSPSAPFSQHGSSGGFLPTTYLFRFHLIGAYADGQRT